MAAAQAGDAGAYTRLLRECVPLVRNTARRCGLPPDRADDVVQDVLLTVHRARATYDPQRPFDAWLRAIAERRAIDHLRQARRHGAREVYAPAAFESHADDSADPARGAELHEARGLISRALARLPDRQREAVRHLLVEEQSLAQAAAATGRSIGALKVNLHRALKALRTHVNRGG
jgi:RNA polymerase sigma-70 factor (ECF subfamily)